VPCASALNRSLDINRYAHTAWTVREGFSKVRSSIAQTPDGYLWFVMEFGLVCFDAFASSLGNLICRMVLPAASKVSIEFVSFGDQTFDAIEKGQLDLMLNADDGYLPPRFGSEVIFDDSFSCVAAKKYSTSQSPDP
jgi:ligand-binding sensor domain-containing protein